METVRVESWNELQDALFAEDWIEEIGRHRSRHAFRGLSDARYQLKTTLIRLGGNYAALERHLLRNFRKYAHRRVVERVLFPGLEGLTAWLKRHDSPTRERSDDSLQRRQRLR